MRLAEFLSVDKITTNLVAQDKESILRHLARILSQDEEDLDEEMVYQVFSERERIATTGVGSGVAIPHGRLDIETPRVVMAISPGGVEFDSMDGEPAQIFVAVLAPEAHPAGQLKMLARISRVLRSEAVRERLLAAADGQAVLDVMIEEESRL